MFVVLYSGAAVLKLTNACVDDLAFMLPVLLVWGGNYNNQVIKKGGNFV